MCFSWQCKGMTHFNQQSLNYKIISRNIQYIAGYSNVVTAFRIHMKTKLITIRYEIDVPERWIYIQ